MNAQPIKKATTTRFRKVPINNQQRYYSLIYNLMYADSIQNLIIIK